LRLWATDPRQLPVYVDQFALGHGEKLGRHCEAVSEHICLVVEFADLLTNSFQCFPYAFHHAAVGIEEFSHHVAEFGSASRAPYAVGQPE
jgi:hypothetical protein